MPERSACRLSLNWKVISRDAGSHNVRQEGSRAEPLPIGPTFLSGSTSTIWTRARTSTWNSCQRCAFR